MLCIRRALFYSASTSVANMMRSSFDEVIGNADTTQLQLMKEMCIQVDEKDNIIGPISKKDGN